MSNWRGIITVVGFTLMVCIALTGAAPVAIADEEQPDVPASYWGTLTVDGELADAGTVVTAEIDGEFQDSIEVQEDGTFGGPTAEDEKLTVEGEEGDEVTFFADGTDFDRTQADQTVELEEFDDRELDLTVSLNGVNGNGGTDDGTDAVAPVANITLQPESPVQVGTEVTLSGNDSTIAEGEIAAFEWTVDGDLVAENETVTKTFDTAGEVHIELLVRSDAGLENTATETLTVESADETQPDDDSDGERVDQADDDGLPGFGVVAVAFALALALTRLSTIGDPS